MNCRTFRKHAVTLLDADPGDPMHVELSAHLRSCPKCAETHDQMARTLSSLQPSYGVAAGPLFKERVMSRIVNLQATNRHETIPLQPMRARVWRPAVAVAAAVLIAAVISQFWRLNVDRGAPPTRPAFSLLSQAWAAEAALFAGDEIRHCVNEIVVTPVDDPELAGMRWTPLVSLEATGRQRIHQLALAAKPGETYTVHDYVWYDPPTGRFTRLLAVGDKPIFANSYDGKAVYWLEVGDGARRVAKTPVAESFKPPTSPASVFGIGAGMRSTLDEDDASVVVPAGHQTLADGSQTRLLKAASGSADSYYLFKVRESDNRIAETEWVAKGQSMLVTRRVRTETVAKPGVGWDLAELSAMPVDKGGPAKVAITPDMVVSDVSIQRMVDKTAFETYIFATDPPWAGKRQITDVLDVASPPHRMFLITYRADDGRHVVLVQGHTYNMLGGMPNVKKADGLYESPTGVKVLPMPAERSTWLAGILLNSARYWIKDRASEDRTGYLLRTPEGTYPALAVNGRLSDDELHALIDSLVPAKQFCPND
ncbi:MAG TPA: hypothetical protein VMZ31_08895 [Phycisphaerae bacterium]|nr:hypothetical protein [Phycisphaerae bacterium]